MDCDELTGWLRLALTPGVGNATARKLLAAFGLPQAIFAQGTEALGQVASAAQCAALQVPPAGLQEQVDATMRWLQSEGGAPRTILTLADPAYPQALLRSEDPPPMLYAVGSLDHGFPAAAISVVGSRNPTPQGAANAHAFSRALAQAGLTVVSGLALGIDTAAHEGALEGAAAGSLATIAVVGTGLDRMYPKSNLALARNIAARGLILSEFPLGTAPLEENFPKRNRIIAALGLGTLVVEAALKSGSLITARLASEQGREVFAIPGSIHSPLSRGCHALLKQGAKLVETAQDVLEELRLAPAHSPRPAASEAQAARDAQAAQAEPAGRTAAVLDAIGFDPVGLDALIARTGIPAPELQARLLELELDGRVARLPGGLLQRIASA